MVDAQVARRIDTSVPHSARIWNYWLGGRDNYRVDRDAGDKYRQAYPEIVDTALACRAFLARTVSFLAGEAGIRQFIDVGSGLPAQENTHQIAQRAAPECRIAYVDNDPVALLHARTLLTSCPQGSCDYVDADMRDPAAVLAGAARTLDLSRPAALVMIGVLGHVPGYDHARSVVDGLLADLPAGSYLVIGDSVHSTRAHGDAGRQYARTGAVPYVLRSQAEFEGFFSGLTLVEPGVTHVHQWRPDPDRPARVHVDSLGGVARKGA